MQEHGGLLCVMGYCAASVTTVRGMASSLWIQVSLYSGARARPSRSSRAVVQQLPVCGILTTPYPCLISRDGRRYLEGAEIGGSVILKIDADSVVLTNSTGRFTWKP